MWKRFNRETLTTIGLLVCLTINPMAIAAKVENNNKLAPIFTEIDQAQAKADWIEVDLLIMNAKRQTVDEAFQFSLLSNQAWAALQMGEVTQAQKHKSTKAYCQRRKIVYQY